MAESLGQCVRRILRESGESLSVGQLYERLSPDSLDGHLPEDKALKALARLEKAGCVFPDKKSERVLAGRHRLIQEAANHLVARGQLSAEGKGKERTFRFCEDASMSKGIVQELLIDMVRLDGTQQRAELRQDVIEEYAEHLDDLPPVIVFFDGKHYYLADGFHRLNAYLLASKIKLPAEVREGTYRDAVLYSVGANAYHGLRRSSADLRRAVETVLADPEWSQASVEWLKKTVNCSWDFANKVRNEWLAKNNMPDGPRTGKNGKKQSPHKNGGGKSQVPAREPEETDEQNDEAVPSPEPEKETAQPKATSSASPRKKSSGIQDKLGNDVPENLHEVFADTRPTSICRQLSDMATAFEVARTTGMTSAMAHLGPKGLQSICAQLEAAHQSFAASMPYCVCISCDGAGKKCQECGGKGFLTAEMHRAGEAQFRREMAGAGGEF